MTAATAEAPTESPTAPASRPAKARLLTTADRTVLLALPHSGHVEPETMRAAYMMALGRNSRTRKVVSDSCGSLLDLNFNVTWCHFVNAAPDAGIPVIDYYCLLASDVDPIIAGRDPWADDRNDGWLDAAIDVLEASPYAAVHFPCAIKDASGLASTAVGRHDEPYGWYRRLSMPELDALPRTGAWGYREACAVMGEAPEPTGCLLPNTGLLLVHRKRFPVCEFPGFNCENRLVWKWRDTGNYVRTPATILGSVNEYGVRELLPEYVGRVVRQAEFAPEDWQLGRWGAAYGVRVGASRAILTNHFGRSPFYSGNVWGMCAVDAPNVRTRPVEDKDTAVQ